MNVSRRASLTLRFIAATAWAAVMVLSGLWVIFSVPTQVPILKPSWCVASGLAVAAGGQFVFMILVADRLFPSADRRLVGLVEAACFLAFVGGVGLTAWLVMHAGTGH